MKHCTKCSETKDLAAFSKDRSKKDGLQSRCKECRAAYAKSPVGRQGQRKRQAKYRQTEKGKESQRKSSAIQSIRFPEKKKACNAVTNAVTSKKLPHISTRICVVCLQPAEQYHHYLGYEEEHKLDVLPHCRSCHREVHQTPPNAVEGQSIKERIQSAAT